MQSVAFILIGLGVLTLIGVRFTTSMIMTNATEIGMPKELRDAATFNRRLHESVLGKCQFPPTLQDVKGTVTKPNTW